MGLVLGVQRVCAHTIGHLCTSGVETVRARILVQNGTSAGGMVRLKDLPKLGGLT